MHADVSDRTAPRDASVADPCTGMLGTRNETKLRTGKHRPSKSSRCDVVAQPCSALLEAEDLRHAQQDLRGPRSCDHLFAFCRIDPHRFFAKHWLAVPDSG